MKQTKKMSCWVSNQHKGAIPVEVIRYMDTFIHFLEIVNDGMDACMKDLLNCDNVAEASVVLREYLETCVVNATGNQSQTDMNFLSQEIIADVHEIYDDPFGTPDVESSQIIIGTGSEMALKLMPREECLPDHKWLEKLVDSVSEIEDCEKGTLFLNSIGLERRKIHGLLQVVVRLNGRPVTLKDAEHIMCKVYILVYKTIGERSVSAQPYASKTECHPLRLRSHQTWENDLVSTIMEECIASTDKMFLNGDCGLPNVFRLRGEQDQEHITGDEGAGSGDGTNPVVSGDAQSILTGEAEPKGSGGDDDGSCGVGDGTAVNLEIGPCFDV
jgi:hypothetical protein